MDSSKKGRKGFFLKTYLVIGLVIFVALAISYFVNQLFVNQGLQNTLNANIDNYPLHHEYIHDSLNRLLYASVVLLGIGLIVAIFISQRVSKHFTGIYQQNQNLEQLNWEIKLQQDLLAEEFERSSVILDSVPFACFLWDRDLNLLESNKANNELFDVLDIDEFKRCYASFLPELQPDGSESIEKEKEAIRVAFEQGRNVIDWVYINKKNEEIPCEVHYVRVTFKRDVFVAAYIVDLRQKSKYIEDIEQRDYLLAMNNQISNLLLSSIDKSNFEEYMRKSLALLGTSLNVSRVYLAKNITIDHSLYYQFIHGWTKSIDDNSDMEREPISYDMSFYLRDELLKGNIVQGYKDDLDEGLRSYCIQEGIATLLAIPLFLNKECWGFIGFADFENKRIFTADDMQLLQSAGLMLVSSVNHMEQALVIEQTNELTKILLDATPLACILWDVDGNLIDSNKEARFLFKLEESQAIFTDFTNMFPEYQPDGRLSIEVFKRTLKEAYDKGFVSCDADHVNNDGEVFPTHVTCRRVPYDGDYLIASYIRDLRDYNLMIDTIERRTKLLSAINQVSPLLLNAPLDEGFTENMREGLQILGVTLNVDRVQIWENKTIENELFYQLMYRWASEYAQSEYYVEEGVILPYRNTFDWEHRFSSGENFNGPVASLSQKDQMVLNVYKSKSIMISPIFINKEFWGLLSIHDYRAVRCFTEDEVSLLSSAAFMMVSAIQKNRNEYQIQESLKMTLKANRAKTDFLAKMSHEIRTPLNAIIGLSELTLRESDLSEVSADYIEKVYSSGQSLLSLVNDILDISKIEAGKMVISSFYYETPSLINDVISQNILRLEDKPIEFILDVDANLPFGLKGDDLRIRQIINNLLSNAFKYTKQGFVKMKVKGVYQNELFYLQIEVLDSGQGIKEEDIDNIFINFEQFDTKANRNVEGSGLGLPITKNLVELMGGELLVQSTWGKGSTFTVVIPQEVVNDTIIGEETVESLLSFKYSTNKRLVAERLTVVQLPNARVLVVDDNLTNLEVARGVMRPYGMKVDCVTSGPEAIDLIRKGVIRYNAIFMDHMMPGMDGIEATRIIHEEIDSDYARSIPIIALTANALTGNEKLFLSKGFQDYITKPVDLVQLDTVINHLIKPQMSMDEFGANVTQDDSDDIGTSTPHCLDYEIEGLDIIAGLERYSGDEETYLSILHSYTVNTIPLLDFDEEIDKDSVTEYRIKVHGIKGSSRSIGADSIGNLAEKLENAAKVEDLNFIKENNVVFVKLVKKLIFDIEVMLQEITSSTPKQTLVEPSKQLLLNLREACATYDMDEVEILVKELDSYQYETNQDEVSKILEFAVQLKLSSIKEVIDQLYPTETD